MFFLYIQYCIFIPFFCSAAFMKINRGQCLAVNNVLQHNGEGTNLQHLKVTILLH